jgi:hypothetical protein
MQHDARIAKHELLQQSCITFAFGHGHNSITALITDLAVLPFLL